MGSPPREITPLVELSHVPDIFVSGIGRIDKLGDGMVRIVLYADQRLGDGTTERVVVCKIVRAMASLRQSLKQLADALDAHPAMDSRDSSQVLDS